jgi:hypothetical protein
VQVLAVGTDARTVAVMGGDGRPPLARRGAARSSFQASRDSRQIRPRPCAGIYSYYQGKIEELEVIVRDKTQNLRRLEAQRNELNSKGARLRAAVRQLAPPRPRSRSDRSLGSVHANTRAVRLLREELQLLQEPGSYVGEITKVMGRKKVLVKVGCSAPPRPDARRAATQKHVAWAGRP